MVLPNLYEHTSSIVAKKADLWSSWFLYVGGIFQSPVSGTSWSVHLRGAPGSRYDSCRSDSYLCLKINVLIYNEDCCCYTWQLLAGRPSQQKNLLRKYELWSCLVNVEQTQKKLCVCPNHPPPLWHTCFYSWHLPSNYEWLVNRPGDSCSCAGLEKWITCQVSFFWNLYCLGEQTTVTLSISICTVTYFTFLFHFIF